VSVQKLAARTATKKLIWTEVDPVGKGNLTQPYIYVLTLIFKTNFMCSRHPKNLACGLVNLCPKIKW
jgi:hypothetical protein